jgi:glucose-6-phosphate 1-dehydrogenase
MDTEAPTAVNPLREGLRLERTPEPCTMVIFGASGDLTRRKLLPALYDLSLDGLLPASFAIVGFARSEMTDEQFRQQAREAVLQFSRRPVDPGPWDSFARGLFYTNAGSLNLEDFQRLADLVARVDRERNTGGNRVFYRCHRALTPASRSSWGPVTWRRKARTAPAGPGSSSRSPSGATWRRPAL